ERDGAPDDGRRQDHPFVREPRRVVHLPHGPLAVHHVAVAADPPPGVPAGAHRERADGVRCDVHEPGVPAVAAVGALEALMPETGGYFDARAGGSLDPSGYVKGWAVDRGVALLEAAGLRNFAVNAGGDIWLAGGALPDHEWRVGIEHPVEHQHVAAVVAVRDGA